jgi:hypothetical protein
MLANTASLFLVLKAADLDAVTQPLTFTAIGKCFPTECSETLKMVQSLITVAMKHEDVVDKVVAAAVA